MGKRLNALLGRRSKAWKLRMVANLAVSRIAILTNLHGVRCSQARSDVIQLLHQGYQQRALVRVEQVIKEQNALDALVMIQNCCHLLGERTEMIINSSEFPDEVKEAISSLIFAASRTGEFPELQEIRRILISKYGKDFAYSAVELRYNCRVYPKMVQRLSTERASLETRQNLLMQIAKDNGIALQLEHEALHISRKVEFIEENRNINLQESNEESKEALKIYDITMKDHYPQPQVAASRDAAAAAEDTTKSARAGVELYRNESRDEHSDDDSNSHHREAVDSSTIGLNLASRNHF